MDKNVDYINISQERERTKGKNEQIDCVIATFNEESITI